MPDDLPSRQAIAEAFGQAIRRARGSRTQSWLAQRAGVAQATISRIERGRYRLTVELLVAIAAALEVDVVDLVEFPSTSAA